MPQTVSLSFFRFAGVGPKAWAFAMMGVSRLLLPRVPDVGFWKLCGSGTGEGFTPVPNTAVYAILCTWPDADTAKERVEEETFFARYRRHALESWTVYLTPTQARGNWSGKQPFEPTNHPPLDDPPYDDPPRGSGGSDGEGGPEGPGPGGGRPLAALTRATLKPRNALKFWKQVPDISERIGLDQNVAFKIGIGEVPWMQQVTFSIWPSPEAMADFARKDGPHARAIRAVRDGGWFREELYARFAVTGEHGAWEGRSPLDKFKDRAP
ncbi:MAG: spheroidene monooxygenase [Pseudomonadota bacterium]